MKRITILIFLPILFFSCAKIPVETLSLADAIAKQGEEMHKLNVTLLNKMFKEKSQQIDEFIKNDYTPKYLDNFNKTVLVNTDFKTEFPNMIKSIIPVINGKRDKMQSTLEEQRVKLITKLDDNYKLFSEAVTTLRANLNSAIKVNKSRQQLYSTIDKLSNNKLDLNQVENSLDNFIYKSDNITDGILKLNETINNILNNK